MISSSAVAGARRLLARTASASKSNTRSARCRLGSTTSTTTTTTISSSRRIRASCVSVSTCRSPLASPLLLGESSVCRHHNYANTARTASLAYFSSFGGGGRDDEEKRKKREQEDIEDFLKNGNNIMSSFKGFGALGGGKNNQFGEDGYFDDSEEEDDDDDDENVDGEDDEIYGSTQKASDFFEEMNEGDMYTVGSERRLSPKDAMILKLRKQLKREAEEAHDFLENEIQEKSGRLWTDPYDLDQYLGLRITYNAVPDWSPEYVSETANELVQLYNDPNTGTPKIPSLQELAKLKFNYDRTAPHPGVEKQRKSYGLWRQREFYAMILHDVRQQVTPRMLSDIRAMPNWEDKQDAIDRLFDEITETLKGEDDKYYVIGKHPKFETWVEKAMEQHLKESAKNLNLGSGGTDTAAARAGPVVIDDAEDEFSKSWDDSDDKAVETKDKHVEESNADPNTLENPIFVEYFQQNEDSPEEPVPKVLYPLQVYNRDDRGRMVEEWQMSAHKSSRRIMLRHCMNEIAKHLIEEDDSDSDGKRRPPTRVMVSGRQGCGKSAALAAIVASARQDPKNIVLYIPHGDQMRRNFWYIVPDLHRKGIFNAHIFSQELLIQLATYHEELLATLPMVMDDEEDGLLRVFFTERQRERLLGGLEGDPNRKAGISVIDMINYARKRVRYSGMTFSTIMHMLMNQEQFPFYLIMDEYNCLFSKTGYFFHEEYDAEVKRHIPHHQINIFKHIMEGMYVMPTDLSDYGDLDCDETMGVLRSGWHVEGMMKRGGMVVATSESRAIEPEITRKLVLNAQQQSQMDGEEYYAKAHGPIAVVDVPRLSLEELYYMVANYEAVGMGRLRMNQGEVLMDRNEIEYLNMISGGVAQLLMDACVMD